MADNTGKNRKPGTFDKNDPRINRKGRPRNFNKLRMLAQAIACEMAVDANGDPVIAPDGHALSVAEAMLIQMAHDRRQRRMFLEIAYGKVPEEVNVHADVTVPIPVQMVDYRKGLASRSSEDSEDEK